MPTHAAVPTPLSGPELGAHVGAPSDPAAGVDPAVVHVPVLFLVLVLWGLLKGMLLDPFCLEADMEQWIK